jgi:multicomponent Na+:H+ antiporter subunit F
MLLNTFFELFLLVTATVLVLLLLPCLYLFLKGKTAADKLLVVDLMTTIIIGVIVLYGAIERNAMFIDLGIALAAFSFIGTITLTRYISENRVF